MVASAGKFALESESSWLQALLCMLKYMPVFFFLILLYRVYHCECSFEAVSDCGLPLLSPLSILSLSPSAHFTILCENNLDLVLLHGLGFCFKAFGMNERYKSRREAGPD